MSDYRRQVQGAVGAITVHSPTTYSWLGRRAGRVPQRIAATLTIDAARDELVDAVSRDLYLGFYCRGDMSAPRRMPDDMSDGRTGIEALSRANQGRGSWQSGWQVADVAERAFVVERFGVAVTAFAEDCRADGPHGTAIGAPVSVRLPCESRVLAPGFYVAFGERALTGTDTHDLVRLYWNITAGGGARLMTDITSRLNRRELPFELKIVTDTAQAWRCDTAVLYLPKQSYDESFDVLRSTYRTMRAHIGEPTPALTKRLAPGLGLAEDPGSGASFGEHRCRLIAEGVLHAFARGQRDLAQRTQTVTEHLALSGVDIRRPYLRPGSEDRYAEIGTGGERPAARRGHARQAPGFGDAAMALATQIAGEAIWHGERCTWLGAEPTATQEPRAAMVRTLGADIYNGVAGIGLFLAEIAAASGDRVSQRTARGALLQALSSVKVESPGIYLGAPGVALACAYGGALLNDERLRTGAHSLIRRFVRADGQSDGSLDLLAGTAGTVLALAILHEALEDRALLIAAVDRGERLLQTAEETDGGWSWPGAGSRAQQNLTGLSHGAAGIGLALLELDRAAAEPRFRDAARRAFGYERAAFDARHGNWPDFRLPREVRRRGQAWSSFWCHGAPGIALSRARAHELLGDCVLQEEACIALATTRSWTEQALEAGENCSLCHGLSGNADILLSGRRILPEGAATATAVGIAGIERFGHGREPWPCGAGGGSTPGLMLGLAGIGHFYLRLADETVPSVLLWRGEELSV